MGVIRILSWFSFSRSIVEPVQRLLLCSVLLTLPFICAEKNRAAILWPSSCHLQHHYITTESFSCRSSSKAHTILTLLSHPHRRGDSDHTYYHDCIQAIHRLGRRLALLQSNNPSQSISLLHCLGSACHQYHHRHLHNQGDKHIIDRNHSPPVLNLIYGMTIHYPISNRMSDWPRRGWSFHLTPHVRNDYHQANIHRRVGGRQRGSEIVVPCRYRLLVNTGWWIVFQCRIRQDQWILLHRPFWDLGIHQHMNIGLLSRNDFRTTLV